MWLLLAIAAALGFSVNAVAIKRSVRYVPDIVFSTVLSRGAAGVLLVAVVVSSSGWPGVTAGYVRALAAVILPETGGMLLMALALRAGDLSIVQPILGLIPVIVTIAGAVVLGEVPSPAAAGGIALVAAGVYAVGLESADSWLEPIRALSRTRASWYALGAAVCWSISTIVHKFGIAEVGALPWAASVTLGSAALMGAALPLLGRGRRGVPRAGRSRWTGLMAVAIVAYAVHVATILAALLLAPASHVIAVSSTSTLMSTGLAVLLLGERANVASRVSGALLVTAGAVLIALIG